MAREFEVKLEIPASAVSKVMRLPWLWELASGELRASRLASTYYDTPRYALHERGVTLRVRRVGSAVLQTVKARANGAALPIERDEWEEEIAGDEPQLKLIGRSQLEGMSRKKLRRQLQPCFEVQVDRSAFPIQSANSAIEVAIDRASIVGPSPTSFCEIELELKRGASSELARIARRIASEVPAALVLSTKADRGFALRKSAAPRAVYAEPLLLTAAARIGEAFQTIAWSCLRHFVLNREAVELRDARAVEQMLVGLERLRAAMSAFSELLDGPETDAVHAELQWLAAELRPARELDAFLNDTLAAVRPTHVDPAALTLLCDDVQARLQRALDRAREAVSSERCRQLILRTALWVIAAEWSDGSEPSRHIAPFARRAMRSIARMAGNDLRRFERLDAGQREDLRRALVAFRHVADFFRGVSTKSRVGGHGFISDVNRILSHLDRLNEISAQARLHEDFMRTWTGDGAADAHAAQKAFAMGFVLGQQEEEKRHRARAVARAHGRFAARAPS